MSNREIVERRGRVGQPHPPAALRYVMMIVLLYAGAGPVRAQHQIESVITFDQVAVRGFSGIYDAPEIAHLDTAGADKSSLSTRNPDPAQSPYGRPRLAPVSPLGLVPGEGTSNPSFVQHGLLVESFWAVGIGSPAGYFKRAHFHPPDLSSGFEAQHFGNPDELHGIYIRAVDGRSFGLKGLRYRVTRNRQLPGRPLSIEGFSNYNVNVLIARTFDPRQTIRGQFVAFPVGLPVGNDPSLPWWPLALTGLETLTQVFIASSASVDFDSIVVTRSAGE